LRFAKPTVQLEAIQVLGLDLVGGRLALVLDVYNPNSYDLRGLGLEAERRIRGSGTRCSTEGLPSRPVSTLGSRFR
jgi:hypothetical protein